MIIDSTLWKIAAKVIPLLAFVSFLVLFGYATTLYPGGSQADELSQGFDWIHNYYCNLMDIKAVNGMDNPARISAIYSLVVLCLWVAYTVLQIALVIETQKKWKNIILASGLLAMIFSCLIASRLHNIMIIVSSVFGLILILAVVRRFIINKDYWLLGVCMISCILLLADNIIYYTDFLLIILPVLQKLSVVVVIVFLGMINWRVLQDT